MLDELLPSAWHHVEQYANNPIEADHGQLKRRLRPMRGLQTDRTAQVVIAGHAFVQNLRRGHYELGLDTPPATASRRRVRRTRSSHLTSGGRGIVALAEQKRNGARWSPALSPVMAGLTRHFNADLAVPDAAPSGLYLGGVVVDPALRRRGIGGALTRARMRAAFAEEPEVLYFANVGNHASIAMHRALGFREVTRAVRVPANGFTGGVGIPFRASRSHV